MKTTPWILELEGNTFDDPTWLHTIFTVGNGYIGIRGRIEEFPVAEGQGTYLAGMYDNIEHVPEPVQTPSPVDDYYASYLDRSKTYVERSYINIPNGLHTRFAINGEAIDFRRGILHAMVRRLDVRRGIFSYEAKWEDAAGRLTKITMERFSSMASPHDQYVRYNLTPLNHSEPLHIKSGIDGAVANLQYCPRSAFDIISMDAPAAGHVAMNMKGKALGDHVALGVTHGAESATWVTRKVADQITVETEVPLKQGTPFLFDRRVSVFTNHDGVDLDAKMRNNPAAVGFDAARRQHEGAWEHCWDQADVVVEGNDGDQFRLRFCIYHLLLSAPRTDRQSIGAKGLTGEGYRGLCFWDTDLFIAPFFYHCFPDQGRRHLEFRHRTLPQAMEKATRLGYRGALYPWEVAVSGHEECEEWIAWPYHQFHIVCDVARSVLMYHEVTGDDDFMLGAGIEILVETTRFWMSKAVCRDGVYEIHDVAGPDESHCHSNNNAYTNNLVRHCIHGLDALIERLDAPEVLERLGVADGERAQWLALADGLVLNFDPETRRYQHCDGFYELSDDIEGVMAPKHGQGGSHTVARYATQAINQPDVLMLLHLLGAPADVLRPNWEFYVPRTAHTSSLGAGIHACIAARLGLKEDMLRAFRQASGVDVDNPMHNAGSGVHLASCGGSWLAAVQGIAGIRVGREGVRVSPCLPDDWTAIQGRLIWQGQRFRYAVTHKGTVLTAADDNTVPVPILSASGEQHHLAPGLDMPLRH